MRLGRRARDGMGGFDGTITCRADWALNAGVNHAAKHPEVVSGSSPHIHASVCGTGRRYGLPLEVGTAIDGHNPMCTKRDDG